jgi:pimeloyl-CoA dehydrogenase
MDFSLNDEHVALQDAVRRFCDGEYPSHERGNAETAETVSRRWAGMADLGLLGLPFDAELGGSEQGAVELMLVAQELGRSLGGGAWLSCVVLAGHLVAGDRKRQEDAGAGVRRGRVTLCALARRDACTQVG